jgi:hypothetical protein
MKLSLQRYVPHRDCGGMYSTSLCANFIWLIHPYIHITSAITLHLGRYVHAVIVFVQPLCFIASYYLFGWAGFEIVAPITAAP